MPATNQIQKCDAKTHHVNSGSWAQKASPISKVHPFGEVLKGRKDGESEGDTYL